MKKLKASLIGLVAAGCLALPLSGWAQDENKIEMPKGCAELDDTVVCCGGVKVNQLFKQKQKPYCLPFSSLQSLSNNERGLPRLKPSDNIDILKGTLAPANILPLGLSESEKKDAFQLHDERSLLLLRAKDVDNAPNYCWNLQGKIINISETNIFNDGKIFENCWDKTDTSSNEYHGAWKPLDGDFICPKLTVDDSGEIKLVDEVDPNMNSNRCSQELNSE
jgi:hypothetical protein